MPTTKQHAAVVAVPKDLVQRKQSEIINENPTEKAIALDLARRTALGTFPTVQERVVGLYHEHAIWYEDLRTGLPSWTSDLATTKIMAPERGGSFRKADD